MLEGALKAYRKDADGPLAERLRFLEGLSAIQSEIQSAERAYALTGPETAREALVTGQPLFLSAPPVLPSGEFVAAVQRVAAYVAEEAGLDEPQAAALREADFAGALTEDRLEHAARSTDVFVAEVAEALGASEGADLKPVTVAYVLISALVPVFSAGAVSALEAVGGVDKKAWTLGMCPVCGSPATIGLTGEGTKLHGAERTLWCGLCHTEWEYDRLRCVRCGNRDTSKLRYTYIEGDPAHRLHLCDVCHGYARFVFADELGIPVSLAVEDAVMAELDAVARSQGYTPAGDPESTD